MEFATPQWLGQRVKQAHIDMAMGLWHEMGEEAKSDAPARHARFNEVLAGRAWKRSTKRRIAGVLRALLERAGVAGREALRLAPVRLERDLALGKFGLRPVTDPARRLVESWSEKLSDSQCPSSRRNVLIFFVGRVLPALGLHVDHLPENWCHEARASLDAAASVCTTRAKYRWFSFFCREILATEPPRVRIKRVWREDDGHDAHRIGNADLEKLYDQAQRDPLDELLFLTLVTTGMRLAACARLRIDQVENREVGTTLEKGNKRVQFQLQARVRELLAERLQARQTSSPFVFPSRLGGHLSTTTLRRRFKAVCHAAKKVGPQFHPHALRHSFSHLLLEAGNSIEVVSRLINHSSTATTQKYYLRESVAEATERARIPWLNKRPRVAPLPSFLAPPGGEARERAAKLRKILANLDSIL
jgi:integrase